MSEKPTYVELEKRVLELEKAEFERKRAEDALRESEERYRSLIHKIPAAVVVHDADTQIIAINPNMLELLGFMEDQVLGKAAIDPGWKFFRTNGERMPIEKYPVNQVLATRQPIRDLTVGVYRPYKADLVWVLVNADPVFDDKGDIQQVIVTFVDITERKRAEEALRESERIQNATGKIGKIGGWEHDLATGKAVWTEALHDIIEIPYDQEPPGVNEHLNYYPLQDRKILEEAYNRAVQNGTPFDLELQVYTYRKKLIWCRAQGEPLYKNGKCVAMRGIFQDITDRRQAENALREASDIINRSSSVAFTWENKEGWPVEFVSENVQKVFGYTAEEFMTGKVDYASCVHPEDIERVAKEVAEFSTKEEPTGFIHEPYHIVAQDGSEKIVSDWTFIVRDNDGRITHYKGIVEDITERKRAEEALRKNEREKSAILNAMSELLAYQDINHTVLWTNRAAAESVNEKQENLEGRKCYEIWAGREERCEICPVEKATETGSIHRDKITTPDERVWIITGYPVKNDKGEIIGAVELIVDNTKQEQVERALREAEVEKRTLLDVQPNHVILQNLDLSIIWANRAACESAGLTSEEIVGRHCYEIWPQRDDICPECPVALSIKTGRMQEMIKKTTDGKTWHVRGCPMRNETGKIVSAVEITDDITQRLFLEDQLRQAQKMEAIGTLAGGIAHDFNNILGIIIGNTELAADEIPEWNPAADFIQEIRSASLRAKDVVGKILSFARKTPASRKPIQISTIIDESLKLLRATIPATIDIRPNILCQSEMILADPTEINQVLMNLCTNSAHAMSEEPGVLEVGLETITLNRRSAARYEDLQTGDYAKLTVKDIGKGITPDIMDRIFDPYFTTKDVDEGLGMGLAVVHGIVKKHDGAIKIESEVGKGTTAEVLFPLIETEPEAEVEKPDTLPTGSERILFVDDEVSLVKMFKQMLERLGYHVVGETSSVEALKTFSAETDQFDLVITDMAMPKMAGDQLTQEIIKIRPDIPVILCTGHSDRIHENRAKELGIRAFTMKPLVKANLASTVRKVLDDAKGLTHD